MSWQDIWVPTSPTSSLTVTTKVRWIIGGVITVGLVGYCTWLVLTIFARMPLSAAPGRGGRHNIAPAALHPAAAIVGE